MTRLTNASPAIAARTPTIEANKNLNLRIVVHDEISDHRSTMFFKLKITISCQGAQIPVARRSALLFSLYRRESALSG
jgi:hypothetical protein